VLTGVADPKAVMGGTDAGAHMHMFCGGGGNCWKRQDEQGSRGSTED